MRARRSIIALVSLIVLAATLGAGSSVPAIAAHGFGYANCPTDIDLNISPTRVLYRNAIGLSGRLERDDNADISGETITIRRRPAGSDTTFTVGTTTTDSNGNFYFTHVPPQTAEYWAQWAGNPACPSLRSGDHVVQVRARVTIQTTHTRPPAGFTYAIRGVVRPNHPGQVVTIRWRPVGTSRFRSVTTPLNGESEYFQRFRSRARGTTYEVQTIYHMQHADHLANVTPFIRVTIR